jgi:hypothetical protein
MMTEEVASETSCNLNTITKAIDVAQHNAIINKKHCRKPLEDYIRYLKS